jgi:protein subunit release factor B
MTNANIQLLERARQQLDTLSTRRTRLQVRLETEQAAFKKAQQEAMDLFGTSDIEELRKKLTAHQQEARDAWEKFDRDCKKAEQNLNDIDAALNAGAKATTA